MAKKDKAGKADAAAKAKPKTTGKIPKQIGGVKLSKQFRKSGEKLIEQARTPQGRQVIAAGLAMATAAMARAKANAAHAAPTPPQPPVPPVEAKDGPPPPPPTGGTGTGTVDPAAIADAVGKAATAFIDGFFNRKR